MRKKIISLAMALAMVLSLLPGAAMAEDIALQDATAVGTVTVISSGGIKTEAEKATTVVFGNGATLYYAGQGTDGTSTAGRGEGFHAGIKMTIPSGLTVENNKVVVSETSSTKTYAKYRKTAQWWSDTGDGTYNQWTEWSEIELDGSDYMELWGLVNPNYFGTYGNTTDGILYNRYEFDWNADGTADQTVYLNVTKEAKLMKDGQQVWPEPAVEVTQDGMKPVLANFNVALTGENLPYTGIPALGEVTYAAAADSAPATFSVSPTVANLKAHPTTGTTPNPETDKPWVGIGVPQPAAGVTVKYYAGWAEPACTGEGDQPDNTQTVDTTTYDTFYWGVTEAHKTANDKGYLAAVYSADGKADVKVLYVLDFKNVSLYTEPEPVSVTATFTALTDGTYYEKAPSALGTFEVDQDAQTGKTVTVTGSAKYITEWTAFSSIVDEQAGHYLPINIALTAGQDSYEAVTITGSKTKTIDDLTKADPTLQLIMRLDDLTDGKFTVKYGTDDVYTVDVSGVVLLPNSTTTADKVEVTVDEKEAESLGNLIKDDNITTDANAPVKVEDAGGDKTLTFTGKDGTGAEAKDTTAVTLPKALVDVVTAGDTKADVKVENKNGSVTIPSANLTSVTASDATVEITVAKATTEDVASVTVNNATDDDLTTIQSALDGAATNGVTVTATSNDANLIANVSEANAVTVVITGLDSGKTYVLLCVSGEDDAKTVTSYGEYTGTTAITVKSKHLTTFVPVEKTDANKDALAKVPADSGKVSTVAVNYTRYTSADEGYKQWFSGKLELTGLTANNYYVIQLGSPNGANRVYQVQQADATGKITLIAQAGAKLWVFEAGASNTNLAAGVAAGPVLGGADGYTLPTA